MKHLFKVIIFIAITQSYAQNTTLAKAQKAYLDSDWITAAKLFEQACPQLDLKDRGECILWNALALSQTGNIKDFTLALKKIEALIQTASPKDPIYSDLYMTKAQFETYLNKHEAAIQSLKKAYLSNTKKQQNSLLKVCESIQKAYPKQITIELCNEIRGEKLANSNIDMQKKPTEKETNTSKEEWFIQLGAFGVRSNAVLLVQSLKSQNIYVQIKEKKNSEKTLYLVHSKAFNHQKEAFEYAETVFKPLNMEFSVLKQE
jgi:F0F1-type ATP synthase epsilon subunit